MVKAVRRGNETLSFAALWLLSYTFLLRVPSEVSGACAHSGSLGFALRVLRRCRHAKQPPDNWVLEASRRCSGKRITLYVCASRSARTGQMAVVL